MNKNLPASAAKCNGVFPSLSGLFISISGRYIISSTNFGEFVEQI